MFRGPSLLGVVLALLLGPSLLSGQEGGDCNVPSFAVWNPRTLSNGTRISYFVRPTIVCGGGVRIRADSAVVFEATNFTSLHGNVSFQDDTKRLTAGQAQYFTRSRQLRAWVNPEVTDLSRGSVIRGDTVVLLRATETRPQERLTVTGRRPHATLYPSIQPPEEPDTTSAVDTLAVPDSMAAQEVVPGDTAALEPAQQDTAAVDTLAAADTAAADTLALEPTAVDTAAADTAAADTAAIRPPPLVQEPSDTLVAEPPVGDTAAVLAPPEVVVDPVAMGSERVEEEPGTAVAVAETPYEVDADRMELEGSGFFRATGRVIIRRDSLTAVADSVEYDEAEGTLFLTTEARVETETYQLEGDSIWLDVPQDELKGVRARQDAVLIGEDLHLLAPQIFLFLTEGRMERLVAIGDSALNALTEEELLLRRRYPLAQRLGAGPTFPIRPFASAQDFLLQADSIEIKAPGEILEELKAMGRARGESMARDSLNNEDTPDLIRRDWIEGDTIVATFAEAADTLGAPEDTLAVEVEVLAPPSVGGATEEDTTATRYRLERLLAQGSARSLYRLTPSDSTVMAEEGRLAVSYVVGDQITILMSEGEVERMLVDGATHGFHLEPVATRAEGGVADSVAADTLGGAAAADTLATAGRDGSTTNRRGGDG